MAAEAMSRYFGDSGFGWKRPRLPRLERSDFAGNVSISGLRPIPSLDRAVLFYGL